MAKSEAEKEEFATISPDGDGVFRIAKQMDCTNQGVIGKSCVRNDAGELAVTDVTDDEKMKARVDPYVRLLNVEFELPSDELPQPPPSPPTSAKHSAR